MHPVPRKPIPLEPAEQAARVVGALSDRCWPSYVHRCVLEQVLDYAEVDPQRERGGFLLGGPYFDDRVPGGGNYVEVRAFFPAENVPQRHAASFRFTHETWAALHRALAHQFPGLQLTGWFHTHPNLGVFLSEYDRFIHRNFFASPWMAALVVDPQRREYGWFQWHGDELSDGGFICVDGAPGAGDSTPGERASQ